MNPYTSDFAASQRLIDLEEEMAKSRVWAGSTTEFLVWLARPLVRLWELALLTLQPLPRHAA